jgi:hypothetical protein
MLVASFFVRIEKFTTGKDFRQTLFVPISEDNPPVKMEKPLPWVKID